MSIIPQGIVEKIEPVWTPISSVFEYIRKAIDWIAGQIATKVDIAQQNIYYFLLILLSIWIASKIFFWRNTTINGRAGQFWITVLIVFLVLMFI